MPRKYRFLALLFVPLTASLASAAGMARSANFIIMAHDQTFAEEVLKKAETYRTELAEQWLGQSLPPNVGPAIIHVELSDGEDRGTTWAGANATRKYHKVWLTTSRERALGSTLRHEMLHVVLATRYPQRLPAWIEEGCASQCDDPKRIAVRRQTLAWYASTNNWPSMHRLLGVTNVAPEDQATYTVASSIAEYLLERGDRSTLLACAHQSKTVGWDVALQKAYGIASIHELESNWQSWVKSQVAVADRLERIGLKR